MTSCKNGAIKFAKPVFLAVWLALRTWQLKNRWKNFRGILFLETLQFWLQSDNSNGNFTGIAKSESISRITLAVILATKILP
jgi:hypothetical protein